MPESEDDDNRDNAGLGDDPVDHGVSHYYLLIMIHLGPSDQIF